MNAIRCVFIILCLVALLIIICKTIPNKITEMNNVKVVNDLIRKDII